MENVLVAAAAFAALWYLVGRDAYRLGADELARRRVRRKIRELVEAHEETLVKRRAQLLQTDRYGTVDTSGWADEISYFTNRVVIPRLSSAEKRALVEHGGSLLKTELEDRISDAQARRDEIFEFDPRMSAYDYEHFCAELLERDGWRTHVSAASGDQGVDVMAEKGDVRVAIQCKLYSTPVGNKAVQEVIAGMTFHSGTHACVVSNNSYTPSAISLAQRSGVLLCHHSDLTIELAKLTPEPSGRARLPAGPPSVAVDASRRAPPVGRRGRFPVEPPLTRRTDLAE